MNPNGIDGQIKGEIMLATSKEWGRQGTELQASKGISGLAKTYSFFTPITAHSMSDSSTIGIGLTVSTGKRQLPCEEKETEIQ